MAFVSVALERDEGPTFGGTQAASAQTGPVALDVSLRLRLPDLKF